MGMPDVEQRAYQYQLPVQLAHTTTRDPKHQLLDWAVTTFGAMPVLIACGLGFFIMARAALKKFGVLK